MIKTFAVWFLVLIAAVSSEKCPKNSRGQYPACECLNGAEYDVTYNWCGSALNELGGECPSDGPGIFPNCICSGGKSFIAEKNICSTVNRNECPKGAAGVSPNCDCGEGFHFDEIHWYCRPWYLQDTTTVETVTGTPQCNTFQYGTYPDCHWRPCPENSLNPDDHEPNCRYNYTIGFHTCDDGLVGTYPDCHRPCPQYHYGKYPDCHRIRCQTTHGWSGEFAPDCKYNPVCPPEFPGVWPLCDIYKASSTPKPSTRPIITVPTTQAPIRTVPTVQPIRTVPTVQPIRTVPTVQPIRTVPTVQPIRTVPTVQPTRTRPTVQRTTQRATTPSPFTYLPPTTQSPYLYLPPN